MLNCVSLMYTFVNSVAFRCFPCNFGILVLKNMGAKWALNQGAKFLRCDNGAKIKHVAERLSVGKITISVQIIHIIN